jgi:hypothetical protein
LIVIEELGGGERKQTRFKGFASPPNMYFEAKVHKVTVYKRKSIDQSYAHGEWEGMVVNDE